MVYFFSAAFSCLFISFACRAKKKGSIAFFLLLSIMIPLLVGCMRSFRVGTDTKGYVRSQFRDAQNVYSYSEFTSHHARQSDEVGWAWITYMSSRIFQSFNVNLFVYQMLILPFVFIGAWRHRKFVYMPYFMMLYYIIQWNQSFSAVRQSIAMAIIFMGLNYLEEKHYIKFSLHILVATLFHTSAWVTFTYFLGFHIFICSNTSKRYKLAKNVLLYGTLILMFVIKPIAFSLSSSIPGLNKYIALTERDIVTQRSMNFILYGEALIFLLFPKGGRKVFSKESRGGVCSNFIDILFYSILSFA